MAEIVPQACGQDALDYVKEVHFRDLEIELKQKSTDCDLTEFLESEILGGLAAPSACSSLVILILSIIISLLV